MMLNAKFFAAASAAVVALSCCHISQADAGGVIMLMDPEVQTELKLDLTQTGSIDGLKQDFARSNGLVEVKSHVANILKPEQLQRLSELRIQALGTVSLGCDDVAVALALSEEQRVEVTKLLRSFYDEQEQMSPELLSEQTVAMTSKLKDVLWGVLSGSQQQQLVQMAGEQSKLFEGVAR